MNLDERIAKAEADREVVRGQMAVLARQRHGLALRDREMTAAIAEMRRERADERRANAHRPGLDPRHQAGRYMGVALDVFRRARRPLSQREVGVRGEIRSGTLTYAMKALAADGLIERTGGRDGRSEVWQLTGKGRRRETVRRPGS